MPQFLNWTGKKLVINTRFGARKFESSGTPKARMVVLDKTEIDGVEARRLEYASVSIPPQVEGTFLIVPPWVASAMPDRTDLLCVDSRKLVIDETIYCEHLISTFPVETCPPTIPQATVFDIEGVSIHG